MPYRFVFIQACMVEVTDALQCFVSLPYISFLKLNTGYFEYLLMLVILFGYYTPFWAILSINSFLDLGFSFCFGS